MKRHLLRALARCWPAEVEDRPTLRRALAFLDWPVEPDELLAGSYAGALWLAVIGMLGAAVVGGTVGLAVAVGSLVLGGLALGAARAVELLARARRASALGTAPALLTRTTLRMQLTPAPEAAARFGADATPGALAESLDGHVRRTANGPESALASFAREWREWAPELERACSLVETAGQEPPADRQQTLQRARQVVIDGVHDRTAAFAASIKGPATALYAFGVLLPLSLVALLPALSAAGVPVSLPVLVAVYDIALPGVVVAASGWLLAKRPVAFRSTPIPRSHPDVTTERWHAAVAGLAVGGLVWTGAQLILPRWLAAVAAAGGSIGTALVVAFRPMQSVRERVEAVEKGLADGLALVGRRVKRGAATEHALDAVASELPGATGDVFATAARRQRRLGLTIEAAFTDEHGALATIPSDRAASGAALLALSAREGRPAGEALVTMSDHVETLDEVQQESRRAVGQVTSTLSNTAAIFGPLVGGATVALTDVMGTGGRLGGSVAVDALGLAVGWYVLFLAVVLTTLATGLTHGFDRSLVGYRVGLAVLAATATYITAVVGTGLVV
mgnify:FL=1